jgi:hypothetical protein
VEDFNGFVWVFDALRSPEIIITKVKLFFSSFVHLPITILVLLSFVFMMFQVHTFRLTIVYKYLLFLFGFGTFIFLMGYSGPRLAFPLIASLFLVMLVSLVKQSHVKFLRLLLSFSVIWSLSFFFLTQGPIS